MKRLFEPIVGVIVSFLSWAAWTELLVSLVVAFLGGGMAYLGKWLFSKIVRYLGDKKTEVEED